MSDWKLINWECINTLDETPTKISEDFGLSSAIYHLEAARGDLTDAWIEFKNDEEYVIEKVRRGS